MGVSKAVLENVIFVHQEESNWPLAEGQVGWRGGNLDASMCSDDAVATGGGADGPRAW